MTERIPLKGGLEHDVLTGWRKYIKLHRREKKIAKRSYIKRLRKWMKREVTHE
jgi:hypothetical protein